MPIAPRPPRTPEQLLREILRLYRQLQALPSSERPASHGVRYRAGPAYVALATQIRSLADRYSKISGTGVESLSQAATAAGDPHAGAGQ
jgi:hypothetical protein